MSVHSFPIPRRNQCAECTGITPNRNMICDACGQPGKGYDTPAAFSDEPGYKPLPGSRR